jgi:hypothetical protein
MLDCVFSYVSRLVILGFQEPRIRECVMRDALFRNRAEFVLIDTAGLRFVKKNIMGELVM